MKSWRILPSISLIIIFILVLSLLPTPQPAHAVGIVVNTLDDVHNANGDCSLREAIMAADSDTAVDGCAAGSVADTITFAVSGTITLSSTLPEIRSTINISGSGQAIVIDGANLYGAFQVRSTGNLTLLFVTIQNCRGNSAILSEGALSVWRSVFSANISPGDGGAIYGTSSSSLVITGSSFIGNSAPGNGGAIASSGSLRVEQSTFIENSANLGGGIYGTAASATTVISASTFSGNTATTRGGGLYSLGTLTATQNTFVNNNASSGASIHKQGSNIYLAGNIFQAGTSGPNYSTGGVVAFHDAGYNFSSDGSYGFTGTGSANSVANLNLGPLSGTGPGEHGHIPQTGSPTLGVIPLNTNIDNNGSSLACTRSTYDQRSNLRPITAGTSCSAGAIEVALSICPTPLAISDASELAKCITWANSNSDVTALALDADITLSGALGALPAISTPISLNGDGHFLDGNGAVQVLRVAPMGDLTLEDITVQNGSSAHGGGIMNDGNLTISDSSITGNTSTLSGAGIDNNGTLTVTNTTFSGNSHPGGGGAIHNQGALDISNSTFSGNSADSGGAIHNTAALTVTRCSFSGNSADNGDGGGIYNTGTMTVSHSTFSGNTRLDIGGGGAIGNSGTLIATYNTFYGNNAQFGGTIRSLGGSLHLAGNIFQQGASNNCLIFDTNKNDNGYNLSSDGSCSFTGTGSANNVTLSLGALSNGAHTPQTGSAAIGIIPPGTNILNNSVYLTCNGSTTDQLGASRPINAGTPCSAGAVEVASGLSASISASDPTAAENPPDAGQFTVTLSATNTTGAPISVTYSVSGTADHSGADYTALSGTVSIAPGSASAVITVTPVDDAVDEPDETVIITLTGASLPSVTIGTPNSATVTITDDDTAGLTVTPTTLTTSESGTTASFTVTLTSQPTADVTVALSGVDATEGALDLTTLTFTPANWNVAQTVTVTGVDDTVVDGAIIYTVTVSASGGGYDGLTASVSVTNTDDDAPADIVVAPAMITTSESGAAATFTVALTSQPTADVTVTFSGVHTTEGVLDLTTLTFTAANWNVAQTVAVTGVDDTIVDGAVTYTITGSASGGGYDGLTASVSVTNSDDDIPADIVVAPAMITTSESGAAATFTVALTRQPTADVTVTLSGVDATEGALDLTTLTFTAANWNAAQTVTVTGVDDALIDGAVIYTITASASGGGYDGLTGSVEVTNTDDDTVIAADDDAYTTLEGQPLIVGAASGVLNGDTGGSGSPLQAALDTSTNNGALTLNADGSFTYTPDAGYSGVDSFTYHATDGMNSSAVATVTITVTASSSNSSGGVTAQDDSADTPVNTSARIDVLVNDSDASGDPLHIASASQPAHGSVAIDGQQIIYTPAPGFTGSDTFTYTAANASGTSATASVTVTVWQPVPLCADFDGSTSEIIRASVPAGTVPGGSVFCRILVERRALVRPAAEIGQAGVLSRDVVQAVDVFALLHDGAATARFAQPVTVCLHGAGTLLYLDATAAPRPAIALTSFLQGGYTCASVANAGTVVLVSGAASETASASSGAAALSDCMVTTRDILNLRATPDQAGEVLRLIPYDVRLTAFERAGGWYYVDYLGERGWISAAYVTPSEGCGL